MGSLDHSTRCAEFHDVRGDDDGLHLGFGEREKGSGQSDEVVEQHGWWEHESDVGGAAGHEQ